MGGNALKNTYTRRYERNEYFNLVDEVKSMLSTKLSTKLINDIPAYHNKETFGDLDILVCSENIHYGKVILELFDPNEVVKNGGVYSFDYKQFQIDLILMPEEHYNTAYHYYSWNDAGNLMGRIYKKLGYKLGHKGLYYLVKDGDYQFKDICVSTNLQKIFEFGDYDFERYQEGFDDLGDIFNYVTSSRYFHKDIFLLHNRNHKARVRDAKRDTYRKFLEWCEATEGLPEYEWQSYESKGSYLTTSEHLPFLYKAFEMFDGFEEEYNQTMKDFRESVEFKKKFNGELVMYTVGITGRTLGEFFKFMNNRNKDLREFVLDGNYEDIVDFIHDEYEVFKLS